MQETFFDSHSHLMHARFAEDLDHVMDRARQAAIHHCIAVGTCPETTRQAIHLARTWEGCHASAGISPHDSARVPPSAYEEIEDLAREPQIVAIGEIGLEYHYDFSPRPVQQDALRRQLRLAHRLEKPVIFHHREAEEDFQRIVDEEGLPEAGGVLHCFTGGEVLLHWALRRGLYISYSGLITFPKNESLRALLRQTPLDRLLIETDAPYLAPEPMRGKRCEPAMLVETARVAASVKELSVDDIARITRRNALRLFGLPCPLQGRIAYPIRRSLYLNITNQCPNHCEFCIRFQDRDLKGHSLHLEREPTLDEIIEAIGEYRLQDYEEAVFCGFGEPTCRMEAVIEVAEYLKRRGMRVRLDTNGLGNLINQSDIVPDLPGRIDCVSVSLNTPDPETYQQLCRSSFGSEAWHAVTLFIQKCLAAGLDTRASVVEIPGLDIEKCKELARKLGVPLRRRVYIGIEE